MNRVCKILLIWLLMAALPLQGMAAAVTLSCGSAFSGIGFADPQAADQHTDMFPQAPGEFMHAHASPHVSHDALSDASHHAGMSEHEHDAHQHKDGRCSACAACCFGTIALPSAPIFSVFGNGSDIVTTSPPALAGSHIPPSLERPPRSIFS